MMLTRPWVGVDGYRFRVRWGTVQVRVPADRPCLVEAYLPLLGGVSGLSTGSFWLHPAHPPHLEYSAPYHAWLPGQMGPPGTTRHTGQAAVVLVLVAVVLVLLGMIGLGVLLVVAG